MKKSKETINEVIYEGSYPCPTQSGEFIAYQPEWLDGEEWKRIPTSRTPFNGGVPDPLLFGGIVSTINLFGYAQAWALAWTYSAFAMANGQEVKIRVQAFDVKYNIEARK